MEFDRAAPLFDRRIPVKIQDTIHDSMVFRILLGKKHSEQIYRFELSDDKDPFFYYFYDLTEKNFPQFKFEEKLLVDFHQYPHKVIQLLEFCLLSTANVDGIVSSSPPFTSTSATANISSSVEQVPSSESYFSSVSSSGEILDFFHNFIEAPTSTGSSSTTDANILTKSLKNFDEVSSKIRELIQCGKASSDEEDQTSDEDMASFEKEFSFFNFDDISINFSEDKIFFTEAEDPEPEATSDSYGYPQFEDGVEEEPEEPATADSSLLSTSSSSSSSSSSSPPTTNSSPSSPLHTNLKSSKLPSLPSYSSPGVTSTLILPPGVTYYAKFDESLSTFEVLQKNVFNIMKTINLQLNKASEHDLKVFLLSQMSFVSTKNKQLSSSFKQLFHSSSDLNSCLADLYAQINNNFMHDRVKRKKYTVMLKNYLIGKKLLVTKLFNNAKKVFFQNLQRIQDYNKAALNTYKQKLDDKEKQLQDLQKAYNLLERQYHDLQNTNKILKNNESNLQKKNAYLVVQNNVLAKKNNRRLVYFNKSKKYYERLIRRGKQYKRIIKRLSHANKNSLKASATTSNILKYKDYLINRLYALLTYYKNNVIQNLVSKNYANLKKISELTAFVDNLKKNNSSLTDNVSTHKASIQKLNAFIQELLKKLIGLKSAHSTLNTNYSNLVEQLKVSNETLEKNKNTISFLCEELNKWQTGGMTLTSFSPNLTQTEAHLPHSSFTGSSTPNTTSMFNAAAASGTAASLSVNNSINFSDYFNDTSTLNQETFSTLSSSALPLNTLTSSTPVTASYSASDLSHTQSFDTTKIISAKYSSNYSKSTNKETISTKEKSSSLQDITSSPSTAFPSRLGVTSNKVVQKYLEEIPPPNPVSFAPKGRSKLSQSSPGASAASTPSAVFPLADLEDLPYYSITN